MSGQLSTQCPTDPILDYQENVMGKSGLSLVIGIPLAVAAAALFICTEQVFPKSQIFLSLYF